MDQSCLWLVGGKSIKSYVNVNLGNVNKTGKGLTKIK